MPHESLERARKNPPPVARLGSSSATSLGLAGILRGGAIAVAVAFASSCRADPPTAAPACAVQVDTITLIIRTDRIDTTIVHLCDGKRTP